MSHLQVDIQSHQEVNLSKQLLRHQLEMLNFLFYTDYDIIYETFELKHAAYLQKRKGEVATKFKTQEIARHFDICSERLHIRILRDSVDLDRLLSKLQLLWHSKNIPFFHRYYFHKYAFTAHSKALQHIVTTEEKLIRQQQHIYYSIFRAINAREACLRQLKRSLSQLTSEDVYEYLHVAKERLFEEKRKQQKFKYKIQGYNVKQITDDQNSNLSKTKFQFFSDAFNHLTKLTLYVIQLVVKWKQYIRSLTHDQHKQKERIQYFFYDDNYYLKILTDIGFIKVSFLTNFYQFAIKNDPFLFFTLLAFEKQTQKTIDHQLLKKIFMPPPQLIPDILSKVQLLSEQYKYNIRSRRVYDLRLIKNSYQHAQQKNNFNDQRQPISNVVLSKITPKKPQSLKTFRIRQSQKKQSIVVSYKSPKSPSKIRNTSIPGIREKIIVQTQQSPLKHSTLIDKNPKNDNVEEMVDSQMFKLLKQQVIKKIKLQFQQDQRKNMNKNQALEMYIDGKVKQAMKSIFPYQPQKQIKLPIQFTTFTVPEQQVSTQINKIYKKSIPRFYEMQKTQNQLYKNVKQAQYCYFIKACIGQQQLGKVICTFDRDFKDYKALKVLYIGFYDVSQLELLMLRFVQFLWKYQNSHEITFTFFQPKLNDIIKELITTLESALSINCLVATKQIFSNLAEVRFIFKRKHKNINYIPNKYPFSIHANLSILLSDQKLMLENPQHHQLQLVSYDFLLMEVIRKYIQSDDFIILKEKVSWKNRLKYILDMIISLEKNRNVIINIKMTEAQNITELNKLLSKDNQKLLQASDLVKNNIIKMLSIKLVLTLPFAVKSIYIDNNRYYRFQIKQKMQYWIVDNTQFYIFTTNERKDLKMVLFNGKQYIQSFKNTHQALSVYINRVVNNQPYPPKQIQQLYVPMSRYPSKYDERQDIYASTFRVDDLKPIKRELLVADQFEWFCSMQMQNGIKYDKSKFDIVLQKPLGLGIINIQNSVIYSRIIR